MSLYYDVIVVGGGAAGFFTAINIAEKQPHLKIAILERGKEVLGKVRISGGGRCNVTHACFIPSEFVKYYPRGEKELKGPFNQFCAGDTMAWFERHGVLLKTEEDGRMFPITDSSQTIIDCFVQAAKKLKIEVLTGQSVQGFAKTNLTWRVATMQQVFTCKALVLATGSNPKIWDLLQDLGHTIVPPVPSLFTFNINDARIAGLMGISAMVGLKIKETRGSSMGALLITHWGVSGPAVLRLSAWGARALHALQYKFTLQINWLYDLDFDAVVQDLLAVREQNLKKAVGKFCPFDFPKRLWESLLVACGVDLNLKWVGLSKKSIYKLAEVLTRSEFEVVGKSTFKDEFVTAGGVDLKEIHFKTMQSKKYSNLFFAGEMVNVDAITGGFNFQNAWTAGFIIANHLTIV